jgi:hypothetical protein
MRITSEQRERTYQALQRVANEEGARINRAAFERICDAAERGEPSAIRQLEKVNGVLSLAMLRHATNLSTN